MNTNAAPSSILFQDNNWKIQQLVVPQDAFQKLSLDRKLFIYHLAKAMDAGRDIVWMQLNREGVDLRDLLKGMWLQRDSFSLNGRRAFQDYFLKVFARHTNYNVDANLKILPTGIDESEFRAVAERAGLGEMFKKLRDVIFDPAFRPEYKASQGDMILGSSTNFYGEGVSESLMLKIPKDQREHFLSYPEQSAEGSVRLNVYGANGHFSPALQAIDREMKEVLKYASSEERKVLSAYHEAVMTGDPLKLDYADRLWVQFKPTDVEFVFGFIETYDDPLGARGTFEGTIFLLSRSAEDVRRLTAISKATDYFEKNMPVDEKFKKAPGFIPPSAEGAYMIHAAGGSDGRPFKGVNLPNSGVIREELGSKSYGSLNTMFDTGGIAKDVSAFYLPEYRELLTQVDPTLVGVLQVELHEILGHGSGRNLPGVTEGSFGDIYSPLEEARAELASLYQGLDPDFYSLGILPPTVRADQIRDFQTIMLVGFFTNHIERYQRLSEETTAIRQAHAWARQAMLNRMIHDRVISIDLGSDDIPRIRLNVSLLEARESLGRLWREVQTAKSTGDSEMAKSILETWGVYNADHKMIRAKIIAAQKRLGLPDEHIYLNPRFETVEDGAGEILDIRLRHFEKLPGIEPAIDECVRLLAGR